MLTVVFAAVLSVVPAQATRSDPPEWAKPAAPGPNIPGFKPSATVPEAPPKPKFVWDIPKTLGEVDVPGVTWANGVPTRMHLVVSGWKAQDLEAYLYAAYEKAGLYVPPLDHQIDFMQELFVTGLDVDSGISYTTILQSNRDGTTTCILATANLSARKKTADSDDAPLFPGAKAVLRTSSEGSQVVQFEAPAKPDEVEKFYRDTLGAAGYAESSKLIFHKRGEELQVLVTVDKAAKTQVVVIARPQPTELVDMPPDLDAR